jgi:hypothetical protein
MWHSTGFTLIWKNLVNAKIQTYFKALSGANREED